jgi:hypothetical protein
MLSIVVYAFGKHLIPDFGSCPYESKEKGQWTAQTVSHNTVVVDETSQYPTGNRDVTWPCDSAEKQAKGTLDYFYAGPLLKVVRARSTAVYEGVETVRTLALYEGHIFDIYDVSSTQEHTYDYVLHCDGEIDKLATAGSRAALRFEPRASLGSRCGYQWFNNVRSAFTDGWFGSVLHNSSDSMDLAVFGGPGTEAILADGITNSVDKRMPTLIVRRKARDTSFVAVMTPRRPISILGAPRIEMAGDRTFNIERYPHAAKHGPDEGLFLPKAAGEIAFGRFSCCALAAAYRCDGTTAELVKATRCTLGGLRAEFSAPTSLYIAASPNACEIITGLDADSRIMLKGVPVERARVEEAGAVGRKAIAASVSGNVLSFEVKPLMRYELRW